MNDLEQATKEMNDTRIHCGVCTKVIEWTTLNKFLHPDCFYKIQKEYEDILQETMKDKKGEYETYRKWANACFRHFSQKEGFYD